MVVVSQDRPPALGDHIFMVITVLSVFQDSLYCIALSLSIFNNT